MAAGFMDDGTGPQINNDAPPSTKPSVKQQALYGGTGGGINTAASSVATTGGSRRSDALPPVPKSPKPRIDFELISDGGMVVPKTNTIPIPKGITIATGSLPVLVQSADRYSAVPGESWTVSAQEDTQGDGSIAPLTLPFGKWPEMLPLLKVSGIVVEVYGKYLVSEETLMNIQDAANPHYDIVENGRVKGVPMGKTVPIIRIKTDGFIASGSVRDGLNLTAGVKQVDYIYEGDAVDGIPQAMLDQINWTLGGLPERPEDRFEMLELILTGDYSTTHPNVVKTTADGKLDPNSLKEYLRTVNAKAAGLRRDFNAIKEMYYSGKTPPQEMIGGTTQYSRRAHAFDPAHDNTEAAYTIRTSTITDIQPTPLTQTQTAVNAVATAVVEAQPQTNPTTGASGGENEALIARWQAYGFTPMDKAYLKTNVRTTPMPAPSIFNLLSTNTNNMVTIGGRSIFVGIQWSPSICDKARVVGEITTSFWGFGLSNLSGDMTRLREYYGVGKTNAEYIRLNNQRKAELLDLADKIRTLEVSTGKIY